jgi:hypothetical protein
MIDSCDSRILCARLGIFGMKEEADMHRFLEAILPKHGDDVDRAIAYCVQRWEEYLAAAPDLKWTYGGAHAFFTKGLFDHTGAWPWKEGPPRKPTQLYQESPEITQARDAWFEEKRADIVKGRIM